MSEIKYIDQDIYHIDQRIYDTAWVTKKFLRNRYLVLGFSSAKVLDINGSKYKDAIGVSIDPKRKVVEVGRKGSNLAIAVTDIENVTVDKINGGLKIRVV